MPVDLERRLQRVADTLPTPTDEVREQARKVALAALGSPEGPSRRRLGFLVTAGAISAAAAAAVTIMVAPWQNGPLATERALAALGEQPVVHAIVEASEPRRQSTIIDLASGEKSVEFYRTEYWYDDEREALSVRVSISGQPVTEILDSPAGVFTERGRRPGERPSSPQLDPALAGFATGYRHALESGQARMIGEEIVDGREAIVLRFSLRPVPSGEESWEEVAVDADDYRPLRFRFSSSAAADRANPWSRAPRVVAIETIPRDPRDFTPPELAGARPIETTGVDKQSLTPAEAATALVSPALWPGRAVDGLELSKIELLRPARRWTDGRVTVSRLLMFQYGADPAVGPRRSWLVITEGTSAEETPRFGSEVPPPPPGKLRLTGFGGGDGSEADFWSASMQRDGVYISLQSPQRELIRAA